MNDVIPRSDGYFTEEQSSWLSNGDRSSWLSTGSRSWVPTMVLRSLGFDRWVIRLSFSGPDRRRWKEIWSSTRCAERLSFVSIVWYERLLRIVFLSPRVEEPNSGVKKLINLHTWTTESLVYLSPPVFLHMYNVCDSYGYTAHILSFFLSFFLFLEIFPPFFLFMIFGLPLRLVESFFHILKRKKKENEIINEGIKQNLIFFRYVFCSAFPTHSTGWICFIKHFL